jgi:RNA polymerase sigma-70 factor (ECF subfamily)
MPARRDADTEVLLARAAAGDRSARDHLLERFRPRLRQLIGLRLDRRLAARLDASDVVQESLAEAAGKLDDYLRTRPVPFYPWLRGLALERLIDMYRWHIRTGKRSVRREERALPPLPDESALQLAQRLCAKGSTPSERLARSEASARVRADAPGKMSRFLQAAKEPGARKAIRCLKTNAPRWLARITVREGTRVWHRFWQPGGGYDRIITSAEVLRAVIKYIHANAVRRGLVSKAEDWEWSSARSYAGLRPVKLERDSDVLT